MLNTKKLLYILPDVTYVAELLPAKQDHKFTIQSFRQINGEFLDNRNFIPENITKLISKLDPEEYHLVLPDFLFTNTILEVKETTESKVEAEISDKVLKDLGMSDDSHYHNHFVLTQLKDLSKVQLTAMDKELLQPVVNALAESEVKISGFSPLSWTTKAMISLEPSISLVQMGSFVYLAQHYIGVDQTSSAELDNVEKLAETVKTLKGAEPSIQTLYLLTNELVEETLKKLLSDTLPIQQLTQSTESDSDMPSFVKQIIETGMRTLDIEDFPVPEFDLSGQAVAEVSKNATGTASAGSTANQNEDEDEDQVEKAEDTPSSDSSDSATSAETDKKAPEAKPEQEADKADSPAEANLKAEEKTPAEAVSSSTGALIEPLAPAAAAAATADLPTPNQATAPSEVTISEEEPKASKPTDNPPDPEKSEEALLDLDAKVEADKTFNSEAKPSPDEKSDPLPTTTPTTDGDTSMTDTSTPETPKTETKPESSTASPAPEITSQTTQAAPTVAAQGTPAANNVVVQSSTAAAAPTVAGTVHKPGSTGPKKILKNKNNTNTMLKMFFITVAVLFATVAIGVGIGLGILRLSNQGSDNIETSPVVVESPATETEPSPVPSPSPEPEPVDPTELSILVVNATTIPGKAGELKADLDSEDYGTVDASNAQGDYAAGANYVLMPEENQALISALEAATDLTLKFEAGYATEDPDEEYDAVVVFADESVEAEPEETPASDEEETTDEAATDSTEGTAEETTE